MEGLFNPQSSAVDTVRSLLNSFAGQVTAPLRTLQQQLEQNLPLSSFTTLQSLASMFAIPSTQPVTTPVTVPGTGGSEAPAVTHTTLAPPVPATSPLALPLVVAGVPNVPIPADVPAFAPLQGIVATGVTAPSVVTSSPVVAPKGGSLMDVELQFGGAFGAALRSASLAELALVALPGIGGLLLFTVAGVGVGRRQAKAGVALQASGIARFARQGPIGVVRTGSLIVVRPRTRPRVQRPLRPARVLEPAA